MGYPRGARPGFVAAARAARGSIAGRVGPHHRSRASADIGRNTPFLPWPGAREAVLGGHATFTYVGLAARS